MEKEREGEREDKEKARERGGEREERADTERAREVEVTKCPSRQVFVSLGAECAECHDSYLDTFLLPVRFDDDGGVDLAASCVCMSSISASLAPPLPVLCLSACLPASL